MMRSVSILALFVLVGCEPMDPNPDGPLAPARVVQPVAPAPEPAPEPDAAEPDAEEPDAEEPDGTEDGTADGEPETPAPTSAAEEDLILQARLMGLDPSGLTGGVDTSRPPAAEPAPSTGMIWSPGTPLDGGFGVRLVATVRDAQPPRAILGLPDGREAVVTPGTLLPDAGIAVIAIGRDAVQIATITPQGDHARIETQVVQALYPAVTGGP